MEPGDTGRRTESRWLRSHPTTARQSCSSKRCAWQVEESDEPVHITRDAVRRTIDYVLSVHYDNVDDADTGHTVVTLKGFLADLADAAEAHLDTGRVVVREGVARARRLSGQETQPSRAAARQAAVEVEGDLAATGVRGDLESSQAVGAAVGTVSAPGGRWFRYRALCAELRGLVVPWIRCTVRGDAPGY